MKKLLEEFTEAQIVEIMYKIILMRKPTEKNVEEIVASMREGALDLRKLVISLFLSSEFMDTLLIDAADNHLFFIHNTRVKLIKYIVPKGNAILDIGGANGSLIDYGYPHRFKRLILTDLPPELRIEQLRKSDLQKKWAHRTDVEVILTSMTDFSMLEDDSIDLVWAGQVVEHVTEEELVISLREIKRVLKNGGLFCFDTPNAIMTRIHSPGKLIHPEHKKEYTPDEMRQLVGQHFDIQHELGIVPMPISYETKRYSYHEAVLNNTFSENLDHSYLMYFSCRKQGAVGG